MSHIIAGDPAPTNPSDKLRVEVLAGLGCAFDGIEDPAARAEELLARYDAAKRTEVLAEAVEAARSEYLTDGTGTEEDNAYNNGVTDAIAAIGALTEGVTR